MSTELKTIWKTVNSLPKFYELCYPGGCIGSDVSSELRYKQAQRLSSAHPLWPASNLSLVMVFPQTAGDGAHEHTHRHTDTHTQTPSKGNHISHPPQALAAVIYFSRCLALNGVEWWMGRREGWKPSSQFILVAKEDGGLRKPTVSLVPLILKALSIFPHLPDPVLRPWKEQSVCWFFAVCFKPSQSVWIRPRQRKPAGSSYLITAWVSVS